MIREIDKAHLDDIDSIISCYRKKSEVPVPENFEELIKTGVSDEKVYAYGEYTKEGTLHGIAIFGKEMSRIRFIFAESNPEIERRLVRTLFDRFSNEYSHIISMGQWITEGIAKHFTDIGLVEYPRANMSLEREIVMSQVDPILPENMCLVTYSKSDRDAIADLQFRCYDGTVDQIAIPMFFGSPKICYQGLETLESGRFGEFRDGLSWILQVEDSPIGYCIITCQGGDTGYIASIGINPDHRGKGLGKGIFIHSMKKLVESDSAIKKIDLDVTISNPAFNLYKSIGFGKVSDWSVYTWNKSVV